MRFKVSNRYEVCCCLEQSILCYPREGHCSSVQAAELREGRCMTNQQGLAKDSNETHPGRTGPSAGLVKIHQRSRFLLVWFLLV